MSRLLPVLLIFLLTAVRPVLSAPTLSDEQLKAAYGRAQQVAQMLGMTMGRSIPLECRPLREVEAAFSMKPGSLPGAGMGGYYQQWNPERIWIANDQEMWQVYYYLGSSLAHAWQLENSPRNTSDELSTAFCVWGAYKTLKECGYSQVAARFETIPATANLRRLLKYERENGGLSAVISYMKKETKVP